MKTAHRLKTFLCLLLITVFSSSLPVAAQITTEEEPLGLSILNKRQSYAPLTIQKEKHPDIRLIEAEDALNDPEEAQPLRFAYPIHVNYSLQEAGQWEELPNGDKLWSLDLQFPQALATLALYDKFWLPDGTKFFVYSRETGQSIGAITSEFLTGTRDNPQEFATSMIYGENVTFEYYQPGWVKDTAIISISRIDYAYRFVDNPYEISTRGLGDAGSCNININCTDGNNWQDEKHAVARVSVVTSTGSGWCTCALINNTRQDKTPYVLTANHCLGNFDAESNPNATQWTFYWEYEHTGCANNTYPISPTTIGATIVANNSASDFALLRLTQSPLNLTNVYPYFLGWTRNTPSAGGVSIHHPKGDTKKISTYTQTPATDTFGQSHGLITNATWRVTWAKGTTEGGSSGSPLLTTSGKYIIGQLYGGTASCSAITSPDYYGKFSISWTGNNSTNPKRRLRDWLDPTGSNVNSLSGLSVCSPPPAVTSISGPTKVRINSFATFNATPANNPGGSYEWLVIPEGLGTVALASNTSTVNVQFGNNARSYSVMCRTVSPCAIPGMYYSKQVEATTTGLYSVHANEAKQVTVTPQEGSATVNTSVNYKLYSQATGTISSTGKISASGDKIDCNRLPTGIYILQIGEDENAETHRIILK